MAQKSATIDIVRETPTMDSQTGYSMTPTGDVTIEIKLTGVPGIEAVLKSSGEKSDPLSWQVK